MVIVQKSQLVTNGGAPDATGLPYVSHSDAKSVPAENHYEVIRGGDLAEGEVNAGDKVRASEKPQTSKSSATAKKKRYYTRRR